MRTAKDLLTELKQNGIELAASLRDPTGLRYRLKSAMTTALARKVREHKSDLIFIFPTGCSSDSDKTPVDNLEATFLSLTGNGGGCGRQNTKRKGFFDLWQLAATVLAVGGMSLNNACRSQSDHKYLQGPEWPWTWNAVGLHLSCRNPAISRAWNYQEKAENKGNRKE